MNVYLFSNNMYFYAGVNGIVEEEFGFSVKLITIRMMMRLSESFVIKDDDIFMIATEEFNFTTSVLVMLDYLSVSAFLLPYKRNVLMNTHFFSSFLPCKVDDSYIKNIIKGNITLKTPKMWSLTNKEATVLSYRLQGMEVYSLSRLLTVNIKTIYTHQESALKKLGVKTLSHLHTL